MAKVKIELDIWYDGISIISSEKEIFNVVNEIIEIGSQQCLCEAKLLNLEKLDNQ